MAWLMLAGAILSEVVATLSLRGTSSEFRPVLAVVVVVGYLVSFVLMALAFRTLNVGIVYAIWSGVGTAGTTAAAAVLFHERLNLTAVLGMFVIVAGVVVLAMSGAATHD